MPNHRNQPLIRQVRRWRIALGMSAGAVAAAAVLGLSEAADAHADNSGRPGRWGTRPAGLSKSKRR